MKIASIADVKAKFSAYVKASDHGPVVITRNGKAVAALVPLTGDDDLERLMLGYSPRLRAILSDAKKRLQSGRAVPHDKLWKEVSATAHTAPKKRTA